MARIRLGAFSAFLASIQGGIVAAWAPFALNAFIGPPKDIPRSAFSAFEAFMYVFIISPPVIVAGLLFSVVPITSLFKEYRIRPQFAFLLVCWAALVGWGVMFRNGNYTMALYGAWCGGMSALCWWLTSRWRWETWLVSGFPVTPFFAGYRTSPRFALQLVCWAPLVGWGIMFGTGNFWLAIYCGCVAVIGLWWWLTFSWRRENISEQRPPTSTH